MEMLSIAVYAGTFLKELEVSTSGKEPVRPAGRPEEAHGGGLRDLARAAGALGTVAVLAAFLSLAAR